MNDLPSVPVDRLSLYMTVAEAPAGRVVFLADAHVFGIRYDSGELPGVVYLSGSEVGRFRLTRELRGAAIDVTDFAELRVKVGVAGVLPQRSVGQIVAVPIGAPAELFLQSYVRDSEGEIAPFDLIPLRAGQPPIAEMPFGKIAVGCPEVTWRA